MEINLAVKKVSGKLVINLEQEINQDLLFNYSHALLPWIFIQNMRF